MKISHVKAREVLDSRGNPTLEVQMSLADGATGRAIVPSGASTGIHEALELRDGDTQRYLGKGVQKAVSHVEQTLAPAVVDRPVETIHELDAWLLELDGTAQKSKLGGNTLLGVSMAFAHAMAASRNQPLFAVLGEWMDRGPKQWRLPTPMMNILNGGTHADNGLAIQEFMVVPTGFDRFAEALRAGAEVFHHLKKILHKKGLSTAVGDEGGFAPRVDSNEQAIDLILEAVGNAGYEPGRQMALALDVAASSFYDSSSRRYTMGGQQWDKSQLIEYYQGLVAKYPITSIEDGLEEDDWAGWESLTSALGKEVQLVGDDLFVTQVGRLQRGIDQGVANSILIKMNQVGTVSETLKTLQLAARSDYRAVVSHRSGESEDVTIAHLAVGSGCGQIKTGSLCRSERVAKYNELLRIEEALSPRG